MHFMASPTRAAFVVAACSTIIAISGCADPCYDDGLAQGGCPANSGSETDSGPDTNTMTMTASMTGPTATETLGTDSMASNTESVTDTEIVTDSDGDCPDLQELLIPEVPTFQLVVDQSGSMDEPFGAQTRWEAMRSTLIGMQSGIVTDLQSQVRFGLSLYNNPQGDGPCPVVDTIGPQLDAQDEITTVLDASGPDGDTPTQESLELALQTLQEDDWVGPKYLLLATDGVPDTCALPNPESMMEIAMVEAGVVSAVQAAYDAGIETFVISVGEELSDGHLQDVANAGQGGADAEFYRALNPDELVQAFNDIISGVRGCEIELPSELMEQFAPSCEVSINGDPYAFNDPNGWELNDPTHIELLGNACTAIQEGLVAIEMHCTCVAE
jgi:hypothetical protein